MVIRIYIYVYLTQILLSNVFRKGKVCKFASHSFRTNVFFVNCSMPLGRRRENGPHAVR